MTRAAADGASVPVETVIAEALAYRPLSLEKTEGRGDPMPFGLSPRELEVLRLLAEGLTNAQIAERLFISQRTASTHVRHIFDKLDVTSRSAAVAWAIRTGLA